MIPKSCKRLAEVDFPIAEVSKHAAREKSIRHGHPSTLHLWWARRPLASCRAILLGLLWPDPCDQDCPEEFKEKARELLPHVQGSAGKTDLDLRKALLNFIGDFAKWDFSTHSQYLKISRVLVKAAHGDEPPLVVDPFAGGGSIPLEALRVGCDTFASDLNPVAVLINKVLLEEIPRHGPKLADDLRRVGNEIKEKAEKELKEFYPTDPDGAKPIAYLWARTVKCESPNCGAEIPLVSSYWLLNSGNKKCALRYKIYRSDLKDPQIKFEIFEPQSAEEVQGGNITRAKATCLLCGTVLQPERVRSQLTLQKGGTDVIFDDEGNRIGGATMLAVITIRSGKTGRFYRSPSKDDYFVIFKAQTMLSNLMKESEINAANSVSILPNEPTPAGGGSGAGRAFSVQKYGMMNFGDLFTSRQKLTLCHLINNIKDIKSSDSCRYLLSFAFSIFLRSCNGNARLRPDSSVAPAFGMHTLPITWTFPETVIFGGRSEHFDGAINTIHKVLELGTIYVKSTGQAQVADAVQYPLPDSSANIWFTDPPYYDAVPYSNLSDFFYVWFKRILSNNSFFQDPFDSSNPLTPKKREAVLDERSMTVDGRPKNRTFYEETMAEAFAEGRRILCNDGIGSVIFAHKTTEGWEALLTGIINGGWTITASWPIATEASSRLRARESAALATSVHLICRPRPENAPVGDWGEVLRELPKRVGEWMERLQNEGVRGADLVFACIGPALEIFSRYSKVETAEGEEVKLATYLEKVWEVVGRIALENILGTEESKARNGLAGALEEDARLTALFLWTLQSTKIDRKSCAEFISANENGNEVEATDVDEETSSAFKKKKGYSLVYDVVRRFAQPLGINLPKWEKRIIETEKGVVRLIPISERAKILFGKDGAQNVTTQFEMHPTAKFRQRSLFPEYEATTSTLSACDAQAGKGKHKGRKKATVDISGDGFDTQPLAQTAGRIAPGRAEATTLDRLHAAMLLQASGETNTLRSFLKAETDRSPDFLRLANALSALYPRGSEEKRLLDAMLLAVRK